MSRVGRKPITLPAAVKLTVNGRTVHVEGPRGKLSGLLPEGVSLVQEGQVVHVQAPQPNRKNGGFQGLMRALLQNMVSGVVSGYRHELENNGVGYKFELKGGALHISAGYSHMVVLPVPAAIKATVDKTQTRLVLESPDKAASGEFAAKVKAVKKPEPYKGKGIKHVGEKIRRKAGKTGAK